MAEENRPVPGDPIKVWPPSAPVPSGHVAAGAPPLPTMADHATAGSATGQDRSKMPASKKSKSPPELKDGVREITETIVFVVVLVLLLKTFLAEAFIIPTGSMATTLLGYHKNRVC